MKILALSVLLIAALSGLALLVDLLKKKLPGVWTSVVHGTFAALGFGLTSFSFYQNGVSPALKSAVGLLFLAAMGGIVLVAFHVKKSLAPLLLVAVHALLGLSGFAFLLSVVLGV